MDFGRDELYSEEEEHTSHHKGKLPFSYCSSTCQSSSSSPYKPQQLMGYASGPWDPQIDHMGSWLSTKYDLEEEDNSRLCSEGVAAKHDFMEVSPVNEEDVRRVDSNSSSSALDLSRNTGQGASVSIQKEHMFDKVVTPSDVGKLNRLVIPKQHAEKYFPLDSSSNEKGLLLNFEDRNGKPWRFRYSYWNSSQSYVMTKGWSRFVKEKKLDAGDIVSFQRGIGELGKDRLFIDWRRRPDAPAPPSHFPFHRTIPWSPLLLRPQPAALARENHFHLSRVNNINRSSYYGGYSYDGGVVNPAGAMGSVVYLRSATAPLQVGRGMVEWQQQQPQQQQHPMVFDSVPVVHGKAAAKRLRLFGVNMDCPISDQSEECDMLSSSSATMEPHQLSSSSPHSLQLRLYNGTPLLPRDYLNKGKSSTSTDSDM